MIYNESEQGDVRQITNPDATARAIRAYTIDPASGRTIFNPANASLRQIDPAFGRDPELRIKTWQEPLIFLSYGREWSPEHTTLALVGHTSLRSEISDALRPVTSVNTSGPTTLRTYESSLYSEQDFNLQSLELQHIFKNADQQFIFGARIQDGEIDDQSQVLAAIPTTIAGNAFLVDLLVPDAIDSAGSGSSTHDFTRWSAYGYYTHEVNKELSLIGGLALEGIDFPDGLQSSPRTSSRKQEKLLSPKLGLLWQANDNWVLRAAASRSLSGYSIEDQLRLEPSQLAGLVTSYRSLVPTTVAGTMAGGTNDVLTINMSGELNRDTWLTLEAFHGRFSGSRSFGLYQETVPLPGTFPNDPGEVTVGSYNQKIDYEETSLLARLDHLVNDRLSVGTSARWQRVEIDEATNAPIVATNPLLNDAVSNLYVGSLYGHYQTPEGWFVSGAAEYWMQENDLRGVPLADANMPILNLSVGRALQNQRGRISLSVLNLLAEDNGMNTLNYFIAPPDERVFVLSADFSF